MFRVISIIFAVLISIAFFVSLVVIILFWFNTYQSVLTLIGYLCADILAFGGIYVILSINSSLIAIRRNSDIMIKHVRQKAAESHARQAAQNSGMH